MRTTTRTITAAAVMFAAGLTAGCAGLAGAATTPHNASAASQLSKLVKEVEGGKPFVLHGRDYIGAPAILGYFHPVPANACGAYWTGRDTVGIIWGGLHKQYAIQCIGQHWYLLDVAKKQQLP